MAAAIPAAVMVAGSMYAANQQKKAQQSAMNSQQNWNWMTALQQREWAEQDQATAQKWQQEQLSQARFLAREDAARAKELYDQYRYGDQAAFEKAGQAQIDAARLQSSQQIPNMMNQAAALGMQPGSGQMAKWLRQNQFNTAAQVGQIRGATEMAKATPLYAPPSQIYGNFQYPYQSLPMYQTSIAGMNYQPTESAMAAGAGSISQLAGMYAAMQMLGMGGTQQSAGWNPSALYQGQAGSTPAWSPFGAAFYGREGY